MSGIAGIYGKCDKHLLLKMLEKIKHRGPDNTIILPTDDSTFGINLSLIFDKKELLFNEEGDVCIFFDGFLSNRFALRNALREKHEFRTNSDGELVLHLYEERAEDFIRSLNGMFAFALYDRKNLLLARDPAGLKPLYYGIEDKALYFASELKSLVVSGVREPKTFPPGHTYHSQTRWKKYFNFPEKAIKDSGESAEQIAGHLWQLFLERVKDYIPKDSTPFGILLSGGIDSSAIAAAAMIGENTNMRTFFVGMENSPDIEYARIVAKHLNTKHKEHILSIEEVERILPKVIYHLESFDFPLVRSSVAQFLGLEDASKDIRIGLCGEGGDELFGGYSYLWNIKSEEQLHEELIRITFNSGDTGFQRVDRTMAAHSMEGRMPFMDMDIINLAFSISPRLKLCSKKKITKWILRKCLEPLLPKEVVWQPKRKFWEGAGMSETIKNIAESQITDKELEMEFEKNKMANIRTKEELYCYRLFREYYPESTVQLVGRTLNV